MAVVNDSGEMVRDFPVCLGRPLLDFLFLKKEKTCTHVQREISKESSVTLLNILAIL